MDRHTLDELHALKRRVETMKRRVETLEQEVNALKMPPDLPEIPSIRESIERHNARFPKSKTDTPEKNTYNVHFANDARGVNVISITDDEEP